MPQIKKEKKSEVKEAKYKSIEEQRKEHRKLYDTVYREYSGTRYLLNMPQTVYEIDENGLIVAKNLCDGSLGIEDVLNLSALSTEENTTHYKAPDTLCKINYDFIACRKIGSLIEFSSHPDSPLSVDKVNFNEFLTFYERMKIGKYMFGNGELNLILGYFSHVNETLAETRITGARFKKIFESAISLDAKGFYKTIEDSKFKYIDFTNIQQVGDTVTCLFRNCDIGTLRISDAILHSNITIALNCKIQNLDIQITSSNKENTIEKFVNTDIHNLTYSTTEVPSKVFNSCNIGEMKLYKEELSERRTKGMLSNTKLMNIQEGAFNNCTFKHFEIVAEHCDPNAFLQPIVYSSSYIYTQNFRELENTFYSANPMLLSTLRIFPYDIKLVKLSPGEKELYFEVEKLDYKLDKILNTTDFYNN